MTHRTRAFARASIAAAAAALAVAAPAGASTTNVKVSFDGMPAGNVCTGEAITLYGTAHLVQHGEFVEGGSQHVTAHMNMQGVTGIGDQGNVYRFVESGHSDQQATLGAANVATIEETMNAVSKGSGENSRIHEIIHTTVNANGDMTADHLSFNISCGL